MKTIYKVTVEEIALDVPYTSRTWSVVKDTGDGDSRERGYDYVEAESVKDESHKVFEQTLTELDLAKLVLTINEKGTK